MSREVVRSEPPGRWIGRLLDLFAERGWRTGRELAIAILDEARRTPGPLTEDRIAKVIPNEFVIGNRVARDQVSRAIASALEGWVLQADSGRRLRPHRLERDLIKTLEANLQANCADFSGPAREDFLWLLEASIRWLRTRLDSTRRFAAYLFERDTSKPLELDLHSDYKNFLEGTDAPAWVTTELVEVGAGRVDIGVLFPETRIPVELKRELEEGSAASIKKYLPQAAAYQTTDVCLGVLVVLDLARDPLDPVPNIRDLVWLEAYRDGEGRLRCIVVMRLPGNRRAPSSL